MTTPRELYTVSRVLQMTGLAPETLTHFEDQVGNLLEIRRTSGGNRLFTPGDVAHLKEMKRLAHDEGRSLDEIRDLLFSRASRSPADTLPGNVSRSDLEGGREVSSTANGDSTHLDIRRPDGSPVAVPVRTAGTRDERTDNPDHATAADDAAPLDATAGLPDPLDPEPAGGDDDLDPDDISIPALPVGPTVDLLLEATEGLVQENLKLRKAIDAIAERCVELEGRVEDLGSRRGLFGFLRRG